MTLVKNRAKKLSVAHCRYFNVKGLSVATQRQCWTFVARIEGAMNDVGEEVPRLYSPTYILDVI